MKKIFVCLTLLTTAHLGAALPGQSAMDIGSTGSDQEEQRFQAAATVNPSFSPTKRRAEEAPSSTPNVSSTGTPLKRAKTTNVSSFSSSTQAQLAFQQAQLDLQRSFLAFQQAQLDLQKSQFEFQQAQLNLFSQDYNPPVLGLSDLQPLSPLQSASATAISSSGSINPRPTVIPEVHAIPEAYYPYEPLKNQIEAYPNLILPALQAAMKIQANNEDTEQLNIPRTSKRIYNWKRYVFTDKVKSLFTDAHAEIKEKLINEANSLRGKTQGLTPQMKSYRDNIHLMSLLLNLPYESNNSSFVKILAIMIYEAKTNLSNTDSNLSEMFSHINSDAYKQHIASIYSGDGSREVRILNTFMKACLKSLDKQFPAGLSEAPSLPLTDPIPRLEGSPSAETALELSE